MTTHRHKKDALRAVAMLLAFLMIEMSLTFAAVLPSHEVTVRRNGKDTTVTTQAQTVGELLNELGAGYNDRPVYPLPETKLSDNLVVHVMGKLEKLETIEENLPYETEYVDDPQMPFGQQEILQQGEEGRKRFTYKHGFENGSYQKTLVEMTVSNRPTKAVVRRGIYQTVNTPDGPRAYSKKFACDSTAYTGGGYTATGIVPYEGVAAVDPRIIPLGTELYITGYGYALAADTGGAIRGNIVDVYFENYQDCINWGRRDVTVYILK